VDWAKRIAPGAEVKKRTWPVLIHGVRVADYPQGAEEEHARRIEKENEVPPGAKSPGNEVARKGRGNQGLRALGRGGPCSAWAPRRRDM